MPTPRTPNNLRVLRGDPAKPAPNTAGIGVPNPPSWLGREARSEWRRVLRACAMYPAWLQRVDHAVLTAYCVQWSVFRKAAEDVEKRGPLVPARSSADQARDEEALVKNPAVQVARDAAVQLRALARELGFTPDARQKLDVGKLRDGDDVERLLSPERYLSAPPK